MDTKDFRGLLEAYSEVYDPQENIDEGLRSAVKRLLGGGKKEAEAPKPESRGAELRRRYNVGPEKSDTSAKRQILNRSRARAERDERDYGSSKYSKSVAQKSKAAHERYLKAGYSKYGADDARGSGNKARKRAAALNREEFEFIVNALIEEGYDLSSYTWDEMYEICLDEALTGERYKKVMKKPGGTAYSRMVSADPAKRATRGGKGGESDFGAGDRGSGNRAARRAGTYQEELDIFDVVLEFLQVEGYAETLEEAEWMMANIIDEEAIDIILGEEQLNELSDKKVAKTLKARERRFDRSVDSGAPNKEFHQLRRTERLVASRNKRTGSNIPVDEAFELWVNELVEEGYDLSDYTWDEMYDIYEAEQLDEISDRKVKGMLRKRDAQDVDSGGISGAWMARRRAHQAAARRNERTGSNVKVHPKLSTEDYVNEAQAARNNPEKYEREQAKKSAPVRGERTPMPPRGDKRREDFEKWYAKQMGR